MSLFPSLRDRGKLKNSSYLKPQYSCCYMKEDTQVKVFHRIFLMLLWTTNTSFCLRFIFKNPKILVFLTHVSLGTILQPEWDGKTCTPVEVDLLQLEEMGGKKQPKFRSRLFWKTDLESKDPEKALNSATSNFKSHNTYLLGIPPTINSLTWSYYSQAPYIGQRETETYNTQISQPKYWRCLPPADSNTKYIGYV